MSTLEDEMLKRMGMGSLFSVPNTGGANAELTRLRAENQSARAAIKQLVAQLEAEPMRHMIVQQVLGGSCVVVSAGNTMEVALPPGTKAGVGAIVRVRGNGLQIIDIGGRESAGTVHTVRRVVTDHTAEVEVGGLPHLVFYGCTLKRGDRVVVDPSRTVIVANLGSEDSSSFTVERDTHVDWDDIAGCEDAKAQLIEAIELPHKHAALFKRYGKKPTKGVLLYGAPGCGKTMLAKAAATSLARIHGKRASSGFIYVKGPELLEKWVGNSEATIRALFSRSREHQKQHGYPAVLFIDEADALLGKRGAEGRLVGMEHTIVPTFLAEMDGLDESGPIVLLATNRPDTLDPAIVRDGRIDCKVRVSRPDMATSQVLFEMALRGKPGHYKGLAEESAFALFADRHVVRSFPMGASGKMDLPLRVVVNGAMIVGIVERAAMAAMRREMDGAGSDGITLADIVGAIEVAAKQGADVAFDADVEAWLVGEAKRLAETSKGAK